jgi:hypothetical protein
MKALRLGRFGVVLALLSAAGCGPAMVKVSGRVLFKGEPLPGGLVTFRPESNRVAGVTALIDEQGHYEATLPVGVVRACVTNQHLKPFEPRPPGALLPEKLTPEIRKTIDDASKTRPAGGNAGHNTKRPPGRYVEIPHRYYNPESAELVLRVEKDGQTLDITLNP